MNIDNVNKAIREHQETADNLELKMESIGMYQAFYEQHRQINGSYKIYLNTLSYQDKMQERYNWIFCQMHEALESKMLYEKK